MTKCTLSNAVQPIPKFIATNNVVYKYVQLLIARTEQIDAIAAIHRSSVVHVKCTIYTSKR